MAKTRSQKRAAKARKQFTKRAQEGRWSKEQAAIPREREEDPRVIVLAARCRHNGRTKAEDVSHEMWGDLAGRAIAIAAATLSDRTPAERSIFAEDLWGVFQRLDRVDEAYFRRIIGKSRFPNVARMEHLPTPFETHPDMQVREYMSEDDKDRAAVSNWMRWQGYLGHLSATDHSAIVSALRQRVMLSHAGRLTGAGAAFVNAMRQLVEIERVDDRRKSC